MTHEVRPAGVRIALRRFESIPHSKLQVSSHEVRESLPTETLKFSEFERATE